MIFPGFSFPPTSLACMETVISWHVLDVIHQRRAGKELLVLVDLVDGILEG